MFVSVTALDTSELDGPPDICPVAQLANPPLNTGKNASFSDWATYGQEVQTQWFSMDCQNNSLCDKQTGRLLSLQWFVTWGNNPVENLWARGGPIRHVYGITCSLDGELLRNIFIWMRILLVNAQCPSIWMISVAIIEHFLNLWRHVNDPYTQDWSIGLLKVFFDIIIPNSE